MQRKLEEILVLNARGKERILLRHVIDDFMIFITFRFGLATSQLCVFWMHARSKPCPFEYI